MLPDYRTYQFGKKDWLELIGVFVAKGLLLSFLFYDSYLGFFFLVLFSYYEYKEMQKKKLIRQKQRLTAQFKSMMEALVTSLNAGYSLETSFGDVKRDLSLIYEKDSFILKEMDIILKGMKMNIPVERLLTDFGRRSGNEDVRNFANVVAAAKRNGGNLIHIIQKTVNCISDKISVEEEIQTMIAAKKLEQRIMMVMPYGILLYLRFANRGYLDPLYHNIVGIFLMTVFLMLIYLSNFWAKKIMEICV